MNTNQGPAFKPKMSGVGVVTPKEEAPAVEVPASTHQLEEDKKVG